MTKFKISGIGLDTTNLNYSLPKEIEFDYIHTSIGSNNDYLLDSWFDTSISSLVTSIDFLDCKSSIVSHLNTLGKETIDLLLVESTCDFEKYKDVVNTLLSEKLVSEIGIKNPTSVEQLENLKKNVLDFRIVSFNLSPLEFNKEIVDWCEKNNVMIFSFNPFGGKLSAGVMVDCFTVPYLLNFSAFYSTVVFLSGSVPYESELHREYLDSIMGTEADETLYAMKKSINKLVKPLKKAVYTSLKVEDGVTICSDIPEAFFNSEDMILSVGKPVETYEVSEEDLSGIEKEVAEIISFTEFPEDGKSNGDILSVILPKIKRVFNSKRIHTKFARVGKNSFIISASEIKTHRKLLVKTLSVDTTFYLVSYNNGVFIFKKINTTPQIG